MNTSYLSDRCATFFRCVRRPSRAIAAMAVLLTIVATLGPVRDASAAAVASTVIAGQLRDALGLPVEGGTVRVHAIETMRSAADIAPGAEVGTVELASAVTDGNGKFEVRAAGRPDARRFANPDGTMALLISASDGLSSLFYHVNASPPAVDGGPWLWDADDTRLLDGLTGLSTSAPSEQSLGPATQAPITGLDLSLIPVGLDAGFRNTDMSVGGAPAAGAGACPDYSSSYSYTYRRDAYTVYVPIQRMSTDAEAKATYYWDSTSKTKLEAALERDGAAAGIGFMYSRSQIYNIGASYDYSTWSEYLHRKQWAYGQYDLYCEYGGQWHYQHTEYWPRVMTGGDQRDYDNNAFVCDGSFAIESTASTYWAATGTTVSYNFYFQVAGASMRNVQTNSNYHRLSFNKVSGAVDMTLCGRDDYPSRASQVKEDYSKRQGS